MLKLATELEDPEGCIDLVRKAIALIPRLPRQVLPAIIGILEEAKVLASLTLSAGLQPVPAEANSNRLLPVKDAAQMLGVSPDWLRRHGKETGAEVKVGLRNVRFSERALSEWIERHRARGAKTPVWN